MPSRKRNEILTLQDGDDEAERVSASEGMNSVTDMCNNGSGATGPEIFCERP
jgi:hypothetical protein